MKQLFKFSLMFSLLMVISINLSAQKKKRTEKSKALTERELWLKEMDKMVRPMMYSLAKDSLTVLMPQETSIRVDNKANRVKVQYLEVLGRVLSGIAPWLQLEGGRQRKLLCVISTANGLCRESKTP